MGESRTPCLLFVTVHQRAPCSFISGFWRRKCSSSFIVVHRRCCRNCCLDCRYAHCHLRFTKPVPGMCLCPQTSAERRKLCDLLGVFVHGRSSASVSVGVNIGVTPLDS